MLGQFQKNFKNVIIPKKSSLPQDLKVVTPPHSIRNSCM